MRGRVLLFVMLLSLTVVMAACGGASAPRATSNELIPAMISTSGDAATGMAVFNEQGCTTCHNATTEKLVGPGLAGVMTVAGPVHADAVDYNGKLPNGNARTEENIADWIRVGGQRPNWSYVSA
jgi:cytochrome c